MLSARSQRASIPASRAVARSSNPTPAAARASAAARRPYTTRGYGLSKRTHDHKRTLLNGSRQKSWWSRCTSRDGLSTRRLRSSWHRPGCKWAGSQGDPMKTSRDKDCPGCQEEENLPFELSQRERIWQQYFDDYKKAIDRDPYDALFGWSNRRINALWTKPMSVGWYSFMARERNDWAAQRANDRSTDEPDRHASQPQESATVNSPNSSKPNISATISWSTSGTAAAGQRFADSGELVYDPITMRMVPKTPQSKPPTPTQVGEALDAKAADTVVGNAKYVRPSFDSPQPSPASLSTSETQAAAQKIQSMEQVVDQVRAATDPEGRRSSTKAEQLDRSAVKDAVNAGDPHTNPSASTTINNDLASAALAGDKYATPSRDPEAHPRPEKPSNHDLMTMLKFQRAEAQVKDAKAAVDPYGLRSDVRAEQDGPESTSPQPSAEGVTPSAARYSERLTTSLERAVMQGDKYARPSQDLPAPQGSSKASAPYASAVVDAIKAKESAIQDAKQELDPHNLRTPDFEVSKLEAQKRHRDRTVAQAVGAGTMPSSLPSLEKYSRQSVDPDPASLKSAPLGKEGEANMHSIKAKESAIDNAKDVLDPQGLRAPTAERDHLEAEQASDGKADAHTMPRPQDVDQNYWKKRILDESRDGLSAMHKIKAKEQEIQQAKRSLDLLKAKKDLEQSWQRAQKPSTGSPKDSEFTTPTPMVKSKTASALSNRTSINNWNKYKNAQSTAAAKTSWEALSPAVFRKNKALRFMTVEEFHAHKKALLDRWDKGHRRTLPTKADLVLEEEIKAQKLAMAGFENKWSKFKAGASLKPSTESLYNDSQAQLNSQPSTPGSDSYAVEHSATRSPKSDPGLVQGEGDMSPTVLQFADSTKWYKKPARKLSASDEQDLRDRELVRSIRNVYESSYGRIQTDHRQGQLISKTANELNEGAKASDLDESKRGQVVRPVTYRTYVSKQNGDIRGTILQPTSKLVQDLAAHPVLSTEDARARLNGNLQRIVNEMKDINSILRDKEEIVFANGDVLVTRKSGSPPASMKEGDVGANDAGAGTAHVRQTPRINPIDGTTTPDLTPQTGNFASPTGFVNHDRIPSETESSRQQKETPRSTGSTNTTKDARRVRKEEPVFSGQMPVQRYTIQEVVEILNKRGVGPSIGSRSASSGSINGDGNNGASGPYRNHRHDQQQRRRERRTLRFLKRGAFFAAWTAICCYSTGVLIEYFRNGPRNPPMVEDNRGHAGWDEYSWRGRGQETQAKATQPAEAVVAEPESRERSRSPSPPPRSFADMPLRGAEYPLLGMLGACIWWLVSTGGS